MQLNSEVLKALTTALEPIFATKGEMDKFVASLVKKHFGAQKNDFSLSTMIRGLSARAGQAINHETKESDLNYVEKTLATGATPGSYLVPTVQANEIIQYLSTNGVFRALNPRVWPMNGIQKISVPVATGIPTVAWLGQNTAQTASDPNLGQLSFDLKTRRALLVFPNELLKVSTPALDSILSELLGIAFAEHEDDSFFGTTSKANGPTALYQTAGISTIHAANNSANGGNITYNDFLAILAKAAAVKAKGPFAWVMSPRTYFQRVLGLVDSNSRPLVINAMNGIEDLTKGPNVIPAGRLFGWPVFVTPFLSETESVGSGSNQAHLIFTNPKYLHIADDPGVEVMISLERYLEYNQCCIRGVHRADFGVGPAAGVVCCDGIN